MNQNIDTPTIEEKILAAFPDYVPDPPTEGLFSKEEREARRMAIESIVPKNMTKEEDEAFRAKILRDHGRLP
jgi:hypothetical protein